MKRSDDRILTTHTGALHRPVALQGPIAAQITGGPYDAGALEGTLHDAVAEVVRTQARLGVDVVSDGEMSKSLWMSYAAERIAGLDIVDEGPDLYAAGGIRGTSKDVHDFADFYAQAADQMTWTEPGPEREARAAVTRRRVVCTGPLVYDGYDAVGRDVANLTSAIADVDVAEAFLPVVAPGSVQPWIVNEHYPDDESLFEALAVALREEYRAIVDGGLLVQIDDAFLAEQWDLHLMRDDWDLGRYREWARLAVDALNVALEGIPEDRVRYHVCWGSSNKPHSTDLPLADFVDLVLRVNAQGYVLEAANARHEWEHRVWRDVPLPEGKILIPGVIEHATHVVEHPETVADRILRFAEVVGRENVIAGTDCGLRGRAHPQVAWAKLEALSEGARLASERLWG